MEIYFFRHAHKSLTFDSNPGLSERGLRQAAQVLVALQENKIQAPHAILCSSKIRTQQTMQKVADHLNLKIQVRPELVEQQASETRELMKNRIESLLEYAVKTFAPEAVVYVCTHYDWLEELTGAITITPRLPTISWYPCKYIQLKVENNQWTYIDDGVINE